MNIKTKKYHFGQKVLSMTHEEKKIQNLQQLAALAVQYCSSCDPKLEQFYCRISYLHIVCFDQMYHHPLPSQSSPKQLFHFPSSLQVVFC